jgi:predicted SnoaL-like aldol condensation-catalyzing enzyme
MAEGENIEACKEAALRFLHLVVSGRIEEAYLKHVDMGGRHHNPFFAAGFPALQKSMIQNHTEFPDKQLAIKNVLADGKMVAVHSHIVLQPGDPGMAAVHLFRFQGDRIMEMWDCVQAIPTNSPNEDGAF